MIISLRDSFPVKIIPTIMKVIFTLPGNNHRSGRNTLTCGHGIKSPQITQKKIGVICVICGKKPANAAMSERMSELQNTHLTGSSESPRIEQTFKGDAK
jgi:hypothetical protein